MMKLYRVTGKFGEDKSFVEVVSPLGEFTYARFLFNTFFPVDTWLEENGSLFAVCVFEKYDTKESRPYIVGLFPESENLKLSETLDTRYFLGGKVTASSNKFSFLFGESKITVDVDGKIVIGDSNTEPAVLGNKLVDTLDSLNGTLKNLVTILQSAAAGDAAVATSLGMPGPATLTSSLPQISLELTELSVNIKKILSSNIKIN